MIDKVALVQAVSRKLVDDGRLIEAGWAVVRAHAIPPNAPDIQINEMRMAFYAGAQHLWASVNSILSEDREPTDEDMRRMQLIHDELQQFAAELELRIARPEGKA